MAPEEEFDLDLASGYLAHTPGGASSCPELGHIDCYFCHALPVPQVFHTRSAVCCSRHHPWNVKALKRLRGLAGMNWDEASRQWRERLAVWKERGLA